MNPKIIAQEYIIDLNLPERVRRQETIDIIEEIKNGVIHGVKIALDGNNIINNDENKKDY